MAKFKKGNQAAKGKGPKQAARRGRPSNAVVASLLAWLDSKPDHEKAEGRSVEEICFDTVLETILARDDHKRPYPHGSSMALGLLKYKHGDNEDREGDVEIVVRYPNTKPGGA